MHGQLHAKKGQTNSANKDRFEQNVTISFFKAIANHLNQKYFIRSTFKPIHRPTAILK